MHVCWLSCWPWGLKLQQRGAGCAAGAKEHTVWGTTVCSVDQAKRGRLAHALWQHSQVAALCHTCHRKHVGFFLSMCANYFRILPQITSEISGYWTLYQLPSLIRNSFLLIADTAFKSTRTSVYHFITSFHIHAVRWELRSCFRSLCCRLSRIKPCSSWQWLLSTAFASLLLFFNNGISFHCARGFFLADGFLRS